MLFALFLIMFGGAALGLIGFLCSVIAAGIARKANKQ